jgi:cytochrome c
MENHMAKVKAYLGVSLGVVALLALPACSKRAEDDAAPAATTTAAANTATPAATAPAADNTDTLDGSKFASFTGDAVAGEKVFLNCKTCHAIEAGKNMVGPSLHAIQGRHSGEIPGYSYSAANKGSGIVWTDEKLFQYLENPQRVIPGTKMTYTGVKDPQQRANVIAYLNTLK